MIKNSFAILQKKEELKELQYIPTYDCVMYTVSDLFINRFYFNILILISVLVIKNSFAIPQKNQNILRHI